MTPVVRDTSSPTEVRLDSPAVLACLTTGYPLPSISWTKEGKPINDDLLLARLDIVEFTATVMGDSTDFESSGYTGSGSIKGLLKLHTDVTVDQVRQLGELGVVSLLLFEETERRDTANYTCTATNILTQTTTLTTSSNNIPLVILGECPVHVSVCSQCMQ